MACEIRMGGKTYTREEFDNLPLVEKLEAVLSSPDLETYMEAGITGLNDGGAFTTSVAVDPEVQAAYDSAKTGAETDLINTMNHAKEIRQKIKEVFGKHMNEEQVEMGLIMLDVMASAWAQKNNTYKEAYYLRYADVRDTGTAENIFAGLQSRVTPEQQQTLQEVKESLAQEEIEIEEEVTEQTEEVVNTTEESPSVEPTEDSEFTEEAPNEITQEVADELTEENISETVRETYNLLKRLIPGFDVVKPEDLTRLSEIENNLNQEEELYDDTDEAAIQRISDNLDEEESNYDDEDSISEEDILNRISDNLDEAEDEYDVIDEVIDEFLPTPSETENTPEVVQNVSRIKNIVKSVVRGVTNIKDVISKYGKRLGQFIKNLASRVVDSILGDSQSTSTQENEVVSEVRVNKSKGVAKVREVADKFKRERNIKRPSHPFVKKLESWMSKEIANAYVNSKAVDNSPESIEAYNALEKESLAQYQYIVDSGMKIERWLGEGEPYSSSREMLEDLEKGHMYFLPNDSAFGDGTVDTEGRLGLKKVGVKLDDGYEMTFSEVFRVVHDYFGHGLLGNEFGAIGEENATLQHLELFTAKAAPALIFQTRGQNSWVNFSDANSEANAKFREARRLDKEGKHEEAAKVRQEGQQLFKFAEPKDSIFEDIYNFKFYGTVQRIREERETKNHPNYINSRGANENNDVSSLHPAITSRRAGKYGENIARRSVQEVRRIDGYDVEVVAEYTFDSKLDTLIKKVFPNYKGSKKVYEIKDGAVYSKLLQKHSEGNKFNASVTLHSDEEFSKMRLFVTEDGATGVTLTNEGFLGGAYSSMIVKSPNSLAQMMFLGIKEGAITAEAFDTILPDYYSMFGFKAVSRTAFNDEFKPMKANGALADWDYETYKDFNGGRPDVVFMIYDGGPRETIEERTGMFDMYKTYQKSFTQSFDEWGYDAATNVMNIEAYNRSLTDGYGDVTQSPTIEDEVNAVTIDETIQFQTQSAVQRAAVQAVEGNKFILHALQAPDVGSLVHEFMHVAEQDLDDMDLETLETWSGHKRGTVEFKEAVADGMVKFVSEDHPEISAINEVFSKIAKLLKSLYRNIVASPLDLKLNDNVRMVYARILGAEEAFSRRINAAENEANDLSQSERAAFIKNTYNDKLLKKYAPSQLQTGTKVVRKDGSIGIVGVDDLSGTTAKDRKNGIYELISYPTLRDVGVLIQSRNKPQSSLKNKKQVVPSCT